MPIPEPKANEGKSEFIERCLEWMNENNEGENQEERQGICYSQWEERDDSMSKELRVDQAEIKDWRYDEENGVLTADVLMTKSQVLPYKDDGEVVHELLPPDELARDSWLESIKSKSVTNLHPEEEVNYQNIGDHAKGSLHNDVWTERDGETVEVWATETIYDEDLIRDIRDGKKEQVSIGRFVNVVDESGEFGGAKYDKKQTDFELNHLAHVPQGRAGQDVKVRLDGDLIMAEVVEDASTPSYDGTENKDWSAIKKTFTAFKSALGLPDESWDDLTANQRDEIREHFIDQSGDNFTALGYPVVDPASNNLNRNAVANAKARASQEGASDVLSIANQLWDEHFAENEGDSKPEQIAISDEVRDMKLTIGDKELELGEGLEEEDVESFQDEIDERLHDLREKDDRLEELEDETDDKEQKIGKLEGRLDSLEEKMEEDDVEEKIDQKLALVDKVREVVPDYNWRGKSIKEIKVDLTRAIFDGVDLEGRSDAYIDGRFDAAMEKLEENEGKSITMKPDGDDSETSKVDELRKERIEKFRG